MGCSQSKIENEEAVTRCKERKRFIKSAITARVAFAGTHSCYTVILKDIGAALNDYGQGEVHDLQDHHQLLHGGSQTSAPPPPPVDPLPPPPPPLPKFPAPLLRAVSMPELVMPKSDAKHGETIHEEEDETEAEAEAEAEDEENEEDGSMAMGDFSHHSRNRSAGVGGVGRGGGSKVESSPPAPPPRSNPAPPPPPPETQQNAWDYFFPDTHDMPGPSLSEAEEIKVNNHLSEAEEIKVNSQEFKDKSKNVDVGVVGVSGSGGTGKVESRVPEKEKVIEPEVVTPVKKVKVAVQSQPVAMVAKRGGEIGAPHVSLMQILNDLDDTFLKASQSAYGVSKILEANRMHYHSNFADSRGHIDHSAKLMRVITWNRSITGLQNINDAKDDDYDEHESLASVLDKLLAWEKKLYDEVKAGERMKIEYQRKVASLNKQTKHGTHSEALEKTKSAVSHLHTRYIVDMQSMDLTVSEIAHLRDDHLYPKLVSLVDGMARMWETMNAQHRAQMKIVEDLRALDVSDTPNETTEDHHKRTIQLARVAEDWHSHFSKLVTYQRDYIVALNGWLKLNLLPIESDLREKVSSPPRVHRPPIHALLHAWHENLERLPIELARNAIFSFAAIMENIRLHQVDEVNLKMKCEKSRKELARETREFEEMYYKYMERQTTPDGTDPDRTENVNQKDPIGEKQFKIASLKVRLQEEEEAHQKQCRQVREKSLTSLKSHLPELFRALSDFSFVASGIYKKLVP